MRYFRYKHKPNEFVLDIVKDFLGWVVVTAAAFVWWLAVLLILSMVLMNIWRVSFDSILQYSLILMGVTSAAYLLKIVLGRRKK